MSPKKKKKKKVKILLYGAKGEGQSLAKQLGWKTKEELLKEVLLGSPK